MRNFPSHCHFPQALVLGFYEVFHFPSRSKEIYFALLIPSNYPTMLLNERIVLNLCLRLIGAYPFGIFVDLRRKLKSELGNLVFGLQEFILQLINFQFKSFIFC